MSRKTYRLLAAPADWPRGLPFALVVAGRKVEVGEEFEYEFETDEQEAANLESGLLSVVREGGA